MEPIEFSIVKNIKKGVVHVATYAVSLGAAWLAAKGFPLTPEQQATLVLGLTGAIGTVLTMARNKIKMTWPDKFAWL